MADPRKAQGRRGEEIAAAFLQSQGFRIVDRNWRCRLGEIDLVAEREGELRFVEVKARWNGDFGAPELAVTPEKLRHLAGTVELWLRSHPSSAPYQIDVLAIRIRRDEEPDIHWVENAFR